VSTCPISPRDRQSCTLSPSPSPALQVAPCDRTGAHGARPWFVLTSQTEMTRLNLSSTSLEGPQPDTTHSGGDRGQQVGPLKSTQM
jgi:hypothetical protein